MYYYIAKSINVENASFATKLVKRFDTYEEAESYLWDAAESWREEGLNAYLYDGAGVRLRPNGRGQAWCATALDQDFFVKDGLTIYATPIFMAGGPDGL